MNTHDPEQTLAIVAGIRTPMCKAGGAMQGMTVASLGAHVFRELLDRTGFDPAGIDEVILGCVGGDAREANPARVAALRAGVPQRVPALTVMRNCASGMEVMLLAEQRLRSGDGQVFLCGGAESMSNYPLLMGPELVRFFTGLGKAKTPWQKLRALLRFRLRSLKPRVAIMEGLTDPISGLIMGNTAENVARLFGIRRAEMDAFALQSHQRAASAQAQGRFAREIAPLPAAPKYDRMLADDDGVRANQTMAALGALKPVFDRFHGDVTVGNSCQITDGAVAMLCMSEAKARRLGMAPLALVRGHARAGLDPALMGLGPAHAAPLALQQAGIGLRDLDLVELNEAFAAQVLGCQRAMASKEYCQRQLGLPDALGELDMDKLNVNGGAIALGHPVGASGARIALSLAHELRQRGGRFGLATLCVGGGMGQAMVLEAV